MTKMTTFSEFIDKEWKAEHPHNEITTSGKEGKAFPQVDGTQLMQATFEPLKMIVEELLPVGTTIIAAPPKSGKSRIAYQLITSSLTGGDFLGRRTMRGQCLYLALEDGQRRCQERLGDALQGESIPEGALTIMFNAQRIGEGLEEEIIDWLDSHAEATMVIIDTLQNVRPTSTGKRNPYEVDVAEIIKLQKIFKDRQVALIIIHHTHKDTTEDFVASVSGTYGITASVDTIWVIHKKRGENFGKLSITGRDLDTEGSISVQFDGKLWRIGPALVSEVAFKQQEIYDVIQQNGPIFPKDIAADLGSDRTTIQHIVATMVEHGSIVRTHNGYIINTNVPLWD
jgi:hypothetical protein